MLMLLRPGDPVTDPCTVITLLLLLLLLLLFEYIVCPLLLSTIWCRGASMMLLREHGSSSARRGERKGERRERRKDVYVCLLLRFLACIVHLLAMVSTCTGSDRSIGWSRVARWVEVGRGREDPAHSSYAPNDFDNRTGS